MYTSFLTFTFLNSSLQRGDTEPGRTIFAVVSSLIIAFSCPAFGSGKLQLGESWEYAFEKTMISSRMSGSSTYESMFRGTIGYVLDSIVVKPVGTYWYFSVTDRYTVFNRTKTIPDNFSYDTVVTDTTSHRYMCIINDDMVTVGIDTGLFSFCSMPDTVDSVMGSFQRMKTADTTIIINNIQVSAFARTTTRWFEDKNSSAVTNGSSYDSILWIDSLGAAYRKISFSQKTTYAESIYESNEREVLTLIRHNGVTLAETPAVVTHPESIIRPGDIVVERSPHCFSLLGRVLPVHNTGNVHNGILIVKLQGGSSKKQMLVR